MVSISSSDKMAAWVQASNVLPVMIFALPVGAFADMFDRRCIMICTQTFMMVLSVMLTVLVCTVRISPLLLLTFTFFIGICHVGIEIFPLELSQSADHKVGENDVVQPVVDVKAVHVERCVDALVCGRRPQLLSGH